jgi:hypothetical protein
MKTGHRFELSAWETRRQEHPAVVLPGKADECRPACASGIRDVYMVEVCLHSRESMNRV